MDFIVGLVMLLSWLLMFFIGYMAGRNDGMIRGVMDFLDHLKVPKGYRITSVSYKKINYRDD